MHITLADMAAGAGGAGVFFLLWLGVVAVMIAATWKVFTKAGQPGWAAIVPIYNTVVLCKIVGRPLWWVVAAFIPFVNIAIAIILMVDLAKSFGKEPTFAAVLLLLPFVGFPMLGFGDATYRGPAAS